MAVIFMLPRALILLLHGCHLYASWRKDKNRPLPVLTLLSAQLVVNNNNSAGRPTNTLRNWSYWGFRLLLTACYYRMSEMWSSFGHSPWLPLFLALDERDIDGKDNPRVSMWCANSPRVIIVWRSRASIKSVFIFVAIVIIVWGVVGALSTPPWLLSATAAADALWIKESPM